MKRRSAIGKLAIASAFSLLPPLLAGPQDQTQPEYTIRSEVRLVLLDVSVKDVPGGFVSGLQRENFSVSENGRPQKITVFDNQDVPVTLGILVDESLSMTSKRAEVLTAALTFVGASNPHDEAFIVNFNDRVKLGLPKDMLFSDSLDRLRAALYRGIPQGKTALYDAVVAGLQHLELGREDKKTLVVISDGGDNASKHTRQQMLDMVERSIATIYTIGLFDPDDPDSDPRILDRLARISGGAAYLPKSLDEMIPVCSRIAQDIRTRYTIGYIPPADGAKPVRHIQVRVSAPGHARLIARSRTMYRYDNIGQ